MIYDGITEKVSPSVTRRHGDADLSSERDVKLYYIRQERHDWVARARWFERRRERRITQLLQQQTPDQQILDLGCGTGLITRHLAGHVVGLDANAWALQRAKHHAPHSEYVVGDAEALPFRAGAMHTVVAAEVLEHLPDVTAALAECHRTLAVGGDLVGSVPHVNPIWRPRIRQVFTPLPQLEPFHRAFTISQVQSLLGNFAMHYIVADKLRLSIYFRVRKSLFEGHVLTWNHFWQRQTLLRRFLRNLFNRLFRALVLKQSHIDTNTWVLDAGVGSGSCARLFASEGFRVVGIDFSRIALARARDPRVQLVLGDARQLPFRTAIFGFAYAQGLLEHLGDQDTCLAELRRVASHVSFSVPMRFGLFHIGQVVFDVLGRPWLWPSERYLTRHQVQELMRRHFANWQVRRILIFDIFAQGRRGSGLSR